MIPRPDADLIREFMERRGVRRIPRGVTNSVLFDELPDKVRRRRNPHEIGRHLREKIDAEFPHD